MVTTCFGQCGHHQVLQYVVGETAAIYCAATACMVPLMRTRVVLGVSCSLLFVAWVLKIDKCLRIGL
jgi:hypothetical protein